MNKKPINLEVFQTLESIDSRAFILCRYCICSTGATTLCNWGLLERCKTPSCDKVIANYFGIDECKVWEQRQNHPTLDSCLRCLSRQYRKSLYALSRKWDSCRVRANDKDKK